MKAPLYSAGARYERKATVGFLRRLNRSMVKGGAHIEAIMVVQFVLDWELKRQGRYDKKPGGL